MYDEGSLNYIYTDGALLELPDGNPVGHANYDPTYNHWLQASRYNRVAVMPLVAGNWCVKTKMEPFDMLKILSYYKLLFQHRRHYAVGGGRRVNAAVNIGSNTSMPNFPNLFTIDDTDYVLAHELFAMRYGQVGPFSGDDSNANGNKFMPPNWTQPLPWYPDDPAFNNIQLVPRRNALVPMDLLVWKPNIEHYMLGIIFGRGGGPEELGATFWGQTELSCYDDAQHGIWGMSYKYHERAIVTNEKNLIRVFDVCFDGYCGGNDSRILQWNDNDLQDFRRSTTQLGTCYDGPSLIVMALPTTHVSYEAFPNPCIFHPQSNAGDPQPDRGRTHANTENYRPFAKPTRDNVSSWRTPATHQVFQHYYNMLDISNWMRLNQSQTPGTLAASGETDAYMYSFAGHYTTINKQGQREEMTGSGHLGANFVGVASVREGRGMLPRGMPTLMHQV